MIQFNVKNCAFFLSSSWRFSYSNSLLGSVPWTMPHKTYSAAMFWVASTSRGKNFHAINIAHHCRWCGKRIPMKRVLPVPFLLTTPRGQVKEVCCLCYYVCYYFLLIIFVIIIKRMIFVLLLINILVELRPTCRQLRRTSQVQAQMERDRSQFIHSQK